MGMGWFYEMSEEESWNLYNWGCELAEGSTVNRAEAEIFVGETLSDSGFARFCCEIYIDGGLVGQAFVNTREEAVLCATKDMLGWKEQ